MQLYMRLLYPADIDLILIRINMGRRFPTFIKQCLRSKIHGRKFEYIPPSASHMDLSDMHAEYGINLFLDEVDDSDIISFIMCFPKRARSQVIIRIMLGCSTGFPNELFMEYAGRQTVQGMIEGTGEGWTEDRMIVDETGKMGPNRVRSSVSAKTRARQGKAPIYNYHQNETADGMYRPPAPSPAKPGTVMQPEQSESDDFDETLRAFSMLSMGGEHSFAGSAGSIRRTPEPAYNRNTQETQPESFEIPDVKPVIQPVQSADNAIESNKEVNTEHKTETAHETVHGSGDDIIEQQNHAGYASEAGNESETLVKKAEKKDREKEPEDDFDDDDMMSMFTQMMNH